MLTHEHLLQQLAEQVQQMAKTLQQMQVLPCCTAMTIRSQSPSSSSRHPTRHLNPRLRKHRGILRILNNPRITKNVGGDRRSSRRGSCCSRRGHPQIEGAHPATLCITVDNRLHHESVKLNSVF